MTVNNCYYLDTSANVDFSSLPKYHAYDCKSLYSLLSGSNISNRDAMLRGDLSYVKQYAPSRGGPVSITINGLKALSYEQMSARENANIPAQSGTYGNFVDALGSSFAWVTTEEDGMLVTGKYSFPGSKADLNGQDYPFPTVLTLTGTSNTETGIFSVSLRVSDSGGEVLAGNDFQVKRLNHT